eukprot:COSAG02_NODE_240_length_27672_cov_67.291445_2_plen_101_part_00
MQGVSYTNSVCKSARACYSIIVASTSMHRTYAYTRARPPSATTGMCIHMIIIRYILSVDMAGSEQKSVQCTAEQQSAAVQLYHTAAVPSWTHSSTTVLSE